MRVNAGGKSIMLLADTCYASGPILNNLWGDHLKSDIVQMAHHGHMNPSMEVYAEIAPKACLWCAPIWLYNEPEIPHYLADADRLFKMGRIRMYGTAVTRKWMDILGVKEHYVTGNGTQKIIL